MNTSRGEMLGAGPYSYVGVTEVNLCLKFRVIRCIRCEDAGEEVPEGTLKLNFFVGRLSLDGCIECIESTVNVVKNDSCLASLLGNKGNMYKPQVGDIKDGAEGGHNDVPIAYLLGKF